MQLNLKFGNIQLGFLVHSPSLAQVGQLGLESLILELQLFLQLTNIQLGFLSHWPVLAQYGYWFSCPLLSPHTRPRIVGFGITGAVVLFWLLLFLWGKMFFRHFFFILNLVRGFPLLEFFNTVIPTQIFLQSRNPHPASRIPHPVIPMGTSIGILHPLHTKELRQRRRRGQRERQWTNRFWLAKKQLCTCIAPFRTFLCRYARFHVLSRTGTENNSFLFLFRDFDTILKNSTPKKITNIWRIKPDQMDKVWGSANSLFKWRFRNRRRRCCLKVM